jgi:hypothetical protein
MPAPYLVKHLSGRSRAPARHILQSLPDALFGVCLRSNVEQPLISLGILHDGGCLSLNRKHHRSLALLELFHEVAGPAAKRR